MKATILIPTFVALCVATPLLADHHEKKKEPGFVSLFNGKDLEGWDGNTDFWTVKDGAITGTNTKEKPTKGNTFLIWKGGEVGDFELRLKYKIVGGNSGVQYRSEEKGKWVIGGYQADIDSGTTYSGILYEEKGRGILAKRGERTVVTAGGVEAVGSLGGSNEIQKLIKNEDWNDYRIIARGNQLTHVINGRVTAEVTDLNKEKRKDKGLLALQLHAGPPMVVQFKDIRIKQDNAVDISGNWQIEIPLPNGNKGEPKFSLKQAGKAITGTYEGQLGKDDVTGSIEGNELSITVEGELQGNSVTVVYNGSVAEDGSLKGSLTVNDNETQLTWTGKRSE